MTEDFYEVFDSLGCDFDSDSAHNEALESFKIAGVVPLVADSIQSKTNLGHIAEYLSLLYAVASREKETFQVYEKLYFGMKNVNELSQKQASMSHSG